ncbi:MAG: nitroreductase family protein [Thermomicrobiales bacterium]
MTIIDAPPATITELLAQRRSIRRLDGGDLTPAVIERLQEAVRRTPAAFGVTPWQIVVLHEQQEAFWDEVAAGFRVGLAEDRLPRYLERLEGLRAGAGAILIYEDLAARPALETNWGLAAETAHDFVQQGLGMVQLALWLVLTEAGLVASLQHWDWLIQDRLAPLLDLPTDRFRLIAVLPVGAPAELPREQAADAASPVLRVDPDLRSQRAAGHGATP